MKQAIVFEAVREGYAKDQVECPVTVSALIEFLQDFDGDTPIYLSHDRGYTYGSIDLCDCDVVDLYEEDEE